MIQTFCIFPYVSSENKYKHLTGLSSASNINIIWKTLIIPGFIQVCTFKEN